MKLAPHRIRQLISVLALALFASASAVTHAQGDLNPSRPVRILVGFTPGTPPETIARILAERMQKTTGIAMFIENRPGAAGTIAADLLTKAPPDGHTLMLGVAASLAVAPHLLESARYDPNKAFSPIGIIQRSPYYITLDARLGVRNLRDLAEYARRNPDKLSFGVPGIGTPHHLTLELLMSKTGIKVIPVPFPGMPPIVVELLAGRLSGVVEANIPSVSEQVRQGRLAHVALTDSKRSLAHPDVPTTVEQGFDALTMYSWWGLLGPAGMSAATVKRFNDALNEALSSAEVKQRMKNEGFDEDAQRSSTPTEFADWIRVEHQKAGEIIRAAGIKMQ